jgi:filamentous hemagglutinin
LDDYHAFNDIVDNYAGMATKTPVKNGTLYQLEGSLNGVPGRFEWIIDSSTGRYPGEVSHRMFVPSGTSVGGR